MKLLYQSLFTIIISSSFIHAESNDFINFENDDTLHGKFIGLTSSGKIIWKNDSAEQNISFDTKEVRKILLNKGRLTKPFSHTSYVTLKNQDTIPGEIISLTNDQLTLQTDFAGKLVIQKENILDININPLNEKILYRGPYLENEGWEIKFPASSNFKNLTPEEQEKQKPWKFSNFALSHVGEASSILLKKELPEKYRITLNAHSQQYRYSSFVISADLQIPTFDKDDKFVQQNRSRYSSSIGSYLGTSIVINLQPSNPSLTTYNFNENGVLIETKLQNMLNYTSNNRFNTKTFFDIRVDTKSGNVLLFAEKKMVGNWQIDSPATQFRGLYSGLSMQYNNLAMAKSVISDVIISAWNGVKDSALSLENESRDIVMLNNGTDRYSGKITSIENNEILLKSAYADMAIPKDQVSSISFANNHSDIQPSRRKKDVSVRFHGTGRIVGLLSKSDLGELILESKMIGNIKLKTEYITSIEFTDMDIAYEVSQ